MKYLLWRAGILYFLLFFVYSHAQDDPRTTYGGYPDSATRYTWEVERSSAIWSYELPDNELWSYTGFNATLEVDAENRRAFFLGDGSLQALDLTTGQLIWKYQDNEAEQVVYSQGILVIKANHQENGYVTASAVYGLEANTQRELWRVEAPITYYDLNVVHDKLLLAFPDNFELASFDIYKGQELWRLTSAYGVHGFTVVGGVDSVVIASTVNSGAITTGSLLAIDLETGRLLWEDLAVSSYLGHEGTTLYALSDEYLGEYSTFQRPGVGVINIYDLHEGYKAKKVYDINSPSCYQASCPGVQRVGKVVLDKGFIYAETPYTGVLRFDLSSDETFRGEQVGVSDEIWLTGPYREQLFSGNERALIIRDIENTMMGDWWFGNAPVSRLDIDDNWLLVGFRNGEFAVADLAEQRVKAYFTTATVSFEIRTFGKSYLVGDTVLLQSNNTLYALELPK